jgi:hypothetical protein
VSTGAKDGLRSTLADFSSNKVRQQIGRKVSLHLPKNEEIGGIFVHI